MENLRRKPTYDELINYLELKQPKIKYPNRNATLLRTLLIYRNSTATVG